MVIHLGRSLLNGSSDLTRGIWRATSAGMNQPSLFGLAPGGVCQAVPVFQDTGEPLPHPFTLTPMGRFPFCGTFHIPILGLLPLATTLLSGVRTFLSSRIAGAATTLPVLTGNILQERALRFNHFVDWSFRTFWSLL